MLGTTSSWLTLARSANKEQTYKNRPNGRVLSLSFSAIGPAPTSRACANASLPPRALPLKAPRVLIHASRRYSALGSLESLISISVETASISRFV
jgi:hypothetical protein